MNRFIKRIDPSKESLNNISLNWSRCKEYPYVLSMADSGIALDAGCGHPNNYPLAHELGKKYTKVYGIDIDISSSFQVDNVFYSYGNLTNIEFPDKTFDTIFCISVLEHLEESILKKAIKEFDRVLKDDGKLVLTFDITYDPQRESPPCNFLEHQINGKGVYCGDEYGHTYKISNHLSAEKMVSYFKDYFTSDGEIDYSTDYAINNGNISIFACKLKKR